MSWLRLTKEGLTEWLRKFGKTHRLYGPVWTGSYHEFKLLQDPGEIYWNYRNTRLSPKSLFMPPAEKMFVYSLDPNDPERAILKEAPKDFTPRIIVGIRPCDAYALQLVDKNFITPQYQDPWWFNRRENTIFVGYGCTDPCSTCFCSSVGSGPFDTRGLDVLVVNVDGGFAISFVSERGKELLRREPLGARALSGSEERALQDKMAQAKAAMPKLWDEKAVASRPLLDVFNAQFWEEVQFSCINCGTCTFLCPTCWCFDIQDEVWKERGCRVRLWDSCMFPLFTLHASGHNPRSQKLQRVRQRFMHKLKYYVDKYSDGVACVGCGRCVQFCPVNIDIREVMRLMVSHCQCAL